MLKKLSFLVVLSFFVLGMRQSVFGFVQGIDDSEFKKCIEMCREEEREYVLTCINKFNKKIKLAELDRNHEKIQKYKDKKDRNLYKCKNIASDISFKTCLPFCYIKDDNI